MRGYSLLHKKVILDLFVAGSAPPEQEPRNNKKTFAR
jgi:hypothetical protein